METIIYTQSENRQSQKLQNEILRTSSVQPVMVNDFEGLFKSLWHRISGEVIIVFLVSSENELDLLISNREKLLNSRYILILPSGADDLISKGLSLYPRYLSSTSDGFMDVAAVVRKLIENNIEYKKMLNAENTNININQYG